MDDVFWLSLSELAQKYRTGELSPLAVTTTMVERIEAVAGPISGFETLAAEQALTAAEIATADFQRGEFRSPLHGIPIAVKDLYDTAGLRTAAGTRIMAERIPAQDATVVARLKAAGAVLLGKLKMTEGAGALHHPDIAAPLNPWGQQYYAGASSSGSGVATAGGYCFASLGSETICSIRFPSAFCGAVGLKPTYGRVSRAGVFPLSASLDHVGPLTRSVADAAAMLAVIAGPDERDLSSLLAPVPDYTAELAAGVKGLRLGFDPAFNCVNVAPEIAAAVTAAMGVLAAQGAQLVEIKIPDCAEALMAAATILHADIAYAHRNHFPGNEDDYGPDFRQYIEVGQNLSPVDLAGAADQRRVWIGKMQRLFADVDLVISPTSMYTAPEITGPPMGPGDFRQERLLYSLRFTFPHTLSGHPAMTFPAGFSDIGLPIAIQLVGRHLQESVLLRAGHAFQSATDWHLKHPAKQSS